MTISKERKEYLLNNLLLFMKNEMENAGVTKDGYWFEMKFPEMVHYLSYHEPELVPASEDIAKFIEKCPCEKEELEITIKFGIAHEFLKGSLSKKYKITYLGMNRAEEYEEYLEENVSNNEIILNDYVESDDEKINELIIKSRNLYLTKDLDGALKEIWGAFERIKTVLDSDKQKGAEKLCKCCAISLKADDVSKEFRNLTDVGNNYIIRHTETTKVPITDLNTKVYLYFRMLSLITFAIKQMEVAESDL